jgi:hypothetical protein
MGCGRPNPPLVPGGIVVSAAVAAPPQPKQNPGTLRERVARARRHAQHRQHTQGRKTPPPSAAVRRYAQPWGLCTTAATVAQAVGADAGRMSSEETSRDGHHHWAVRAAVVALPTEAMVTRLSGVVCLAYTLQRHLGQRVRTDPLGQQRRAQWTVTDRVSWFWCGQRLFDAPGYDWRPWLGQQWEHLGCPVVAAPATSVPELVLAEAA